MGLCVSANVYFVFVCMYLLVCMCSHVPTFKHVHLCSNCVFACTCNNTHVHTCVGDSCLFNFLPVLQSICPGHCVHCIFIHTLVVLCECPHFLLCWITGLCEDRTTLMQTDCSILLFQVEPVADLFAPINTDDKHSVSSNHIDRLLLNQLSVPSNHFGYC